METVTTETSTTAGMVRHKTKWIVKGCIVGLMAILFMIPMVYVKELIREREERQRTVVNEISSKWAGAQNIAGPVLCVPYLQTELDAEKKAINNATRPICAACWIGFIFANTAMVKIKPN